MAGEREGGERHRDAHVDADHAGMAAAGELAGVVAGAGVDAGTVREGVGVHHGDALLEVGDPLDRRDRAEDLVGAGPVVGADVVEDRRTHPVATLVTVDGDLAAVEHERAALIDAPLDAGGNEVAVLGRDDRAELALRQVGRAEPQLGSHAGQHLHDLVSDGVLDAHDGQGHTALPRAAEGGVDDAGHRTLEDGVLEDQCVVLGLGERLHALTCTRRGLVDVLAHGGGADEGDAPDGRVHQQAVGLDAGAGDEVGDTLGQAGLDQELHHAHRGLRDHRSCLQHEGVAGGDAERQHPTHRDHRREVVRRDACEHTQRLAVGRGVVATGDVHRGVALHQVVRRARALDDLDGLQHITAGLGEDLAHLGGQQDAQLVQVLVEELLEAEHQLDALRQRGGGPGGEGTGGGIHGRVDLVLGATRRLGDLLTRGRVHHGHIGAGLRLAPLVVHEVAEPLQPGGALGRRCGLFGQGHVGSSRSRSVRASRGSTGCPSQVCRTQACAGSSQISQALVCPGPAITFR